MSVADEPALPRLREDVRLLATGRAANGAPAYVVNDPAANAFFQIGWLEFEILSRWGLGKAEAIITAIRERTTLRPAEANIKSVLNFAEAQGLLRLDSKSLLKRKHANGQAKAGDPGAWLAEVALFRKVPLVRPQRFLRATLPLVEPLFSRWFLAAMALLFCADAYLVARDGARFLAGFSAFYSVEGFFGVSIALTIAKAVHELAHAWSAARHGVEVPSMGVSLIMGWPVLYTETSGAWGLGDSRKRFEIATAGIAAELVLATLALTAWNVLEPGPARNAMLFASTSMIALSLTINLNPFMRFDGYFALSEILGIDNLQPRAMALAQWLLRRLVAGDRAASPETLLRRRVRWPLLVYGFGMLAYRGLLYGGMAYGFFAFTFPELALPMGIAIAGSFLAKPVYREVRTWFRTASARFGRAFGPLRVLLILGPLLAIPFIPWRTTVVVPVVLRSGEVHRIYLPEAARVETIAVSEGLRVSAGEMLAAFISPDLDYKLKSGILQARTLNSELMQHRTAAVGQELALVQESELSRLFAEINGLAERRQRLKLVAPAAARVTAIEPGLKSGRWTAADAQVFELVESGPPTAIGFVEEGDLARIELGARATVTIEGEPLSALSAKVSRISEEAAAALDEPVLTAPNGGPIAVRQDQKGRQVPETAHYRLVLALDAEAKALPLVATRGYARIETAPSALITRLLDRVLGIIRRELQ